MWVNRTVWHTLCFGEIYTLLSLLAMMELPLLGHYHTFFRLLSHIIGCDALCNREIQPTEYQAIHPQLNKIMKDVQRIVVNYIQFHFPHA